MSGLLESTQVGRADLVESKIDQEKGQPMRTLTVIPEHGEQRNRRAFTPLIDAKAASSLLGVPYTWLLAQARAGNIPHHRLGHYVRFDPNDLQAWLREERIEPYGAGRRVR